jgi:hypothetical protein
LVTDWNPLTAWIYEECYIRFIPIDYDINNLKEKYGPKLNIRVMHLTNNSVVKYSEFADSSGIEGNMWSDE